MIETTSGLIGFADTLENLHELLTDDRQQSKIFELCDEFSGWRRCKGDGNCFYRACGFALIEAALCGGDPQMLRPITESFQTAAGGDALDLVALLYELPDQEPMGAIELWYQALLCNADMDAQLVRSLRLVCAEWLQDNRRRKFNGMPISTFVQSCHGTDLDDFIRMEVLADGKEAEQLVIHAATQALGSRIEIIQVDRTEGPAQRYSMPEEGAAAGKVSATLLFRPGHYDIFYRRELFSEVARLQDELQLRRACGQEAAPGAILEDSFDPFPGRGLMKAGAADPADDNRPVRTISTTSQETRFGVHVDDSHNSAIAGSGGCRRRAPSGSVEDAVGTMRREMEDSLARCMASVDREKEDLGSSLRQLDTDKATLRDLRKEVEALRKQLDAESEDLRVQQDELSRVRAEAAPPAGFWAFCVCPAPPTVNEL